MSTLLYSSLVILVVLYTTSFTPVTCEDSGEDLRQTVAFNVSMLSDRQRASQDVFVDAVVEGIYSSNTLRNLFDISYTSPVKFSFHVHNYNEKSGALALITIRGVEVAANQGAATILRDDIASTISDSGRSVSLWSRRLDPPLTKTKGECQASQYKLYAANGTEIPTYGLKILTLDLGLRRPFQWPFIIAKVERGIIGADFLQKFQLLIDLHNRKLIDGVTNLSIKGEVATIQENNDLSTVNRASKYFNLLKLYPDLTKPNLVNRVVKHEVKHHILTTGQPVYSKARQLAPDKLKLAKQEFQFMLDNDIIRPSKSQWASPLHLVNKKGWHIKTMWRLQATQRTDNTRSISNS
ncbi:transposon Ty3-I Gag-Pol polyprotein [Trichonephila clavipes]|uniref:Transposon Ty3-I Gag-Pol polyprotein n=1 Tax=Trichonephila clavipes TaxID=2585209 RepID=A0A8X6VM58_TRICX|nr:transposon Ty3-I Gag-Pol polyprotein [Trichonephila clavipes]